ncbi:MAG TPA: inositol monophosphatase [Acidimicrobiales bacterium]|nr:inositol monophosphatase [Acidimicrobiales bacterium]
MEGDQILKVLDETARAVRSALDDLDDWGPVGTREGQYGCDLAADAAALEVLLGAGFGVLSEESGLTSSERDMLVVVDPVDGSTNAARGLPWFATSLCALDADGPLAAVVVNQATGEHFSAQRGGGARRNGVVMNPASGGPGPSGCLVLAEAMVAVTSTPPQALGWRQVRALGAVALDLCAVACGHLDAYIDCSVGTHNPWDYLGAMLVCTESGAPIVDLTGRDLVTRLPGERRSPVAAATPELLAEAVAARSRFP